MPYALAIHSNRCLGCSAAWTTSQVIEQTDTGFSFPSNHPAVTQSLIANNSAISCYFHSEVLHPLCFNCLNPINLPQGWPKRTLKPYSAPARSTPRIDVEDLLK